MAQNKTNAQRMLERANISFQSYEYPHGEGAVDGLQVARLLKQDPERVFKTLVTRGNRNSVFVFVIPVACELDLKKAAKAAGEKSISMAAVSELLGLTGYVRGGCSPIGMKKQYPTFFHQSAQEYPTIMVSAGRIGMQIEAAPQDLMQLTNGKLAALITERNS